MGTSEVYKAIEEIVDEWDLLGINLSIPPPTLNTIKRDFHKTKDQKTEMIQVWMTGRSMPTWCSLVEALHSPSTDQPRIATSISQEYSKAAIVLRYTHDNGRVYCSVFMYNYIYIIRHAKVP